jgi:leucyl aminopeptidase
VAYISKNYKLDSIITIATLTWVAMHALWFRYAWVMWNDRFIIDRILENSKTDFEKYCELPFDNYYVEKCKWDIADLDNWTKWVFTWASMWAWFIYNFILNNEKFTHLDIAWVANNSYEPYWLFSKWTTWFWVDSMSKLFLSL